MAVSDWVSRRVFQFVHENNLVYNTCWEDPRLDRQALSLGGGDHILVITSAGCNTLDYCLSEPRRVYAVDLNPRQNALLELKLAGIRHLEYEDFFEMFGRGRLHDASRTYQQALRPHLPEYAQNYWDRWIKFFDNPKRSFYFRGASGAFARLVNLYMDRIIKVRPYVNQLLDAPDLDEQRRIYQQDIRQRLWSRPMRFAMNRDATLSMVGVPKAQRRQVETQYQGGLVKFVQDCMDAVFGQLPLSDNYFWRVYMTGRYSRNCCPEYLKAENFEKLRHGLADRITVHNDSVQGFLEKNDVSISKYVLLDHMDWLSDHFFSLLEAEWQAIVNRAAPGARLIWRSGGLRTDFLQQVEVVVQGKKHCLPELLTYHDELARRLHAQDRVHTYGSFYIADLAA